MARAEKLKLSINDVFVGSVYGRLTVLNIVPFSNVGGIQKPSISSCLCICGNIFDLPTRRLRDVRSCGCIEKDRVHHKGKTPVYSIWNTIKTRCFCKTSRQFPDYGGRGIVMCDGFKNSFLFFETKIGIRPTKKHSVDRIDNNGNYSCGECEQCLKNNWVMNVRWADRYMQAGNTRTNIYINLEGERMCLAEAARRYNISYGLVRARVKTLKWDIKKALTTPVKIYK